MKLAPEILLTVADANGWNHMDGWGWGMAIFGWLFMAALVTLVGWLIWLTTRHPGEARDRRDRALSLLNERYAEGGIERDEYVRRKADIEQ